MVVKANVVAGTRGLGGVVKSSSSLVKVSSVVPVESWSKN